MTLGVKDTQRIEYVFNVEMFMSDIRIKSGVTTLRDIAKETGISASTLSRWDKGNLPDLESFLVVCGRLQMQPQNYFNKQVWELKK